LRRRASHDQPSCLWSTSLSISAIVLALGCSSSTETHQPPPPSQLTHPAGNITTITPVAGFTHGISIAADGTMLLTRLDSGDIVSGRANDFVLGPVLRVGATPVDVALTPDGRIAFVPINSGPHIAVVDVRAVKVIDSLTIFSWPLRALVTPDGNHVYITTTGGLSDTVSNIYDFDAHSHALIDTIVVGAYVNGIAFNAHSDRLYVSSQGTNSVYEIDATNDGILRRISVGPVPQDIAVSADDSELWVATQGDVGVQAYDLGTGALIQSVAGTSQAYGLAMSPDGAQLYVARDNANMCAIIDAQTRSIVKPLDLGYAPQRIAFNATGSRAIFTGGSGAVLIQ
jgi:DNA-binding beta-propeller fold protein YncE